MSGGTLVLPAAGSRPASMQERRRLVAASLCVGNPANNARDLPAQADPRFECQIELEVGQIRPYECNPRRTQNPRFADIKESIRACGVRNPLAVTRRPGEEHFIVESGGNSRLLAVQQLWAETGEARFGRLSVLFRPWRCESHVLIAHLIENEQRGDMTFWDKANGIAALKTQMEAEHGRTLSVRQLEADLKQVGITVSHTTLNYYRFATERLPLLGDVVTDLSGGDVIRLQPRLNLFKQYAQSRASLDEDVLYEKVLEPVFRRHAAAYREARDFSPKALCRDCEAALARHLNEPLEQCRRGVASLAKSASATDSAGQDGDDRQRQGATDETPDGTFADLTVRSAVKGVYSGLARQDAVDVNPLYSASTASASPVIEASALAQTQFRADASLPGASPSCPDRSGDVDQQLRDAIECFARLAGVHECLRPGTTPLGYAVIEWPPTDGTGLPSAQRRARWLLTLLCGCLGQDAAASMETAEDDAVPHCAGAPVIDMPFLWWMFDSSDESATAFRRIMALLFARRALAAGMPVQGGQTLLPGACVT